MSRYINVDDLKADMIIEERDFTSCGVHLDYASVRGVTMAQILTTPSIDIVRCKECRWGKPYSDKQLECDALGLGGLKFPDNFCSYGEREGE